MPVADVSEAGFHFDLFFLPLPRENCQRRAGLRLFSVGEIVSIMTTLCFPDWFRSTKKV